MAKENEDKKKNVRSRVTSEAKKIKKQFAKSTLQLVTSGFGLVAALAWNQLIQNAVSTYVTPYFGEGSGLVSMAIYALIVTILAVLVTYQLSKFSADNE